ncbi:MAG TPA: M20/M25/M40 family metallo-hydrolase, partial [Holophagaceae bacterium]|nr:M20/M25/M40 family metallo-hydrolase [Holophagaceae bacterium]
MRILTAALLPLIAASLVGQDAAAARRYYDAKLAARTVPLLQEVLRFPTVAGDTKAWESQKAWLLKTGKDLGFEVQDAGRVTEIELPGPKGSPVLGLVVHGDVQPVDDHWTIRPFDGVVKDGQVLGRGAADDKGPLVQALLAMKALKEAGAPRTYTLRLLMGSDEESTNLDMAEYLKTHEAPAFSLVLDSAFPVVVGEKAWNALTVETKVEVQSTCEGCMGWVGHLEAGLAPSIVPDTARLELVGLAAMKLGKGGVVPIAEGIRHKSVPPGVRFELKDEKGGLDIIVHG